MKHSLLGYRKIQSMYSVVSHYPIEFRIIGDKRYVGVQDFKIESATSDIINLLFQSSTIVHIAFR